MSHADKGDFFNGLIRCFCLAARPVANINIVYDFREFGSSRDAVDSENCNHAAIQFGVPEVVFRQGLHPEGFNDEAFCLQFIAEEIVIVYVIDLETCIRMRRKKWSV